MRTKLKNVSGMGINANHTLPCIGFYDYVDFVFKKETNVVLPADM